MESVFFIIAVIAFFALKYFLFDSVKYPSKNKQKKDYELGDGLTDDSHNSRDDDHFDGTHNSFDAGSGFDGGGGGGGGGD